VPATPRVGETFDVSLDAKGTGAMRAVSAMLDYDREVVEPVGVERGELLALQASASVVLSSEPGNVDVALIGASTGLTGSGELARVRFRVKAAGAPAVALRRVEARGGANQSLEIGIERTPAADVLPARTALLPASPSPFSASTTLRFSLRAAGPVELSVFDVQGRVIRTLVDGPREPGEHAVAWDGRDEDGRRASPGLYLVRLRAGGRPYLRDVWITR
jgi:hypothetical protein